ncbi:hypothetical protein lerEdw1_010160 [Lerista edwardsae]|nr:hypothetical protein lerEdw1_010160 [Lerista edwardsae]
MEEALTAGGGEGQAVTAAVEPCVALRLVAAAAWHVVQERQIRNFPQVLALLDAVWEAAPSLVHYRHLAKLRLGLQAKVIMTMLQEEQPDGKIYTAVDTYFPENEPQSHPRVTAEDLKLVQAAQENFRDLVLGLLSDCRQREKYVQEHLETDYGAAFVQVVEDLFCDYLWQLESTLPEPCFQKVLGKHLLEAATIHGPHQASPDPDILSRYLTDMGYRPIGESGDIVMDSGSESGSSPFRKGEYQCTQHNTLIPTLQEHLPSGSRQ